MGTAHAIAEVADVVATIERDGFAVVPDVLDPDAVAHARERLWEASARSQQRGVPTHNAALDPNAANIRVFDLVDLDWHFAELLEHPVADAVTGGFLGPEYIVSNITANIARPGSGSMFIHSDQALVAPEPWSTPWALNIIWCLDDVHADNGATRYLPGSHRITTRADVPADIADRLVPFEARAGSIIAMEGRVWHTSGCNVTADEDRALVFAYCTKPFVRPQWNFTAALRPEVQQRCSPTLRYRLGLDVSANVLQAAQFVQR
jgi:ectoine hydroxylase-related dioxygenase (phytanoyl-CoA dioxygenase family)